MIGQRILKGKKRNIKMNCDKIFYLKTLQSNETRWYELLHVVISYNLAALSFFCPRFNYSVGYFFNVLHAKQIMINIYSMFYLATTGNVKITPNYTLVLSTLANIFHILVDFALKWDSN